HEHLEADGILTPDPFLFWIDANIEMVIEQITVGAIAAVFATENVGLTLRACRRLAKCVKSPHDQHNSNPTRNHGLNSQRILLFEILDRSYGGIVTRNLRKLK